MSLVGRIARPVDLLDLVGRANKQRRVHGQTWPQCARCKRGVEAVEAVEWKGTSARIRGWCHGKDDVVEVKFPRALNIDENEDDMVLWRALGRSVVFFDPELKR